MTSACLSMAGLGFLEMGKILYDVAKEDEDRGIVQNFVAPM